MSEQPARPEISASMPTASPRAGNPNAVAMNPKTVGALTRSTLLTL
jgi:hypothetical protein